MNFSLEDKLSWDELAPSLQNLIKNAGMSKDEVNSMINTATTNVTNTINNIANETDSPLKKYIDTCDFLNFSPKAGFLDENTVPLFASYNMSFNPYDFFPAKVVTDASGREVQYFTANNGRSDSPLKLYKAYRLNDNESFIYYNTPLQPAHLPSGSYPIYVYGLGNEYIAYSANVSGTTKYYLVKNQGSSNPLTWTSALEITSIIGSCVNLQYFEEYGTIAIFRRSGTSFTLSLYKESDLSLIKQIALYTFAFDISGYAENSGINERYINMSTMYNPTLKHIVIYQSYYSVVRQTSTTQRYFSECSALQVLSVSETIFKDGNGTIIPLIPSDQYKWCDTSLLGIYNSDCWAMTYDEYEDCIRVTRKTWYDSGSTMYRVSAKNRTLDRGYLVGNSENTLTMILPDACPWAKIIFNSFLFVGNLLYFYARSMKYGDTPVCTEYLTNSLDNGYIKFSPGKWWMPTTNIESSEIVGSFTYLTIVKTSTGVRYIAAFSKDIKEMSVGSFVDSSGITRNGKRTLTPIGVQLPDVPSIYSNRGATAYDPIRNKVYFHVYDITSSDPSRQNYCFILQYDFNTGSWTPFKNTSASIDAVSNYSKNDLCTNPDVYPATNTLIDNDGNIYFAYAAKTVGGETTSDIVKLNPNTGVYTDTNIGPGSYYQYGLKTVGWNEYLGYYATISSGYQVGRIVSSKDITGSGAEKTIDEFFSGNFYNSYIGLAASTGLVAYLQSTPIFLGGYYSEVPQQEIALNPNSNNYIYFIRDRADRTKVNVSNRNKIIGVAGETSFNRVLVSNILTDSANPISQTDYEIGNGGSSQVLALTGSIRNGATIPLPDGFTQDQCKWMVFPHYMDDDVAGGEDMHGFSSYGTSDRRAVILVEGKVSDSSYGDYFIIGIK